MLSRRDFVTGLSCAAAASRLPAFPQPPADFRLKIAPTSFEVSPHRFLKTTAYNSQVPGPLLRLREGREVTVEITNHSEYPEIVHWHGLFLPGEVDGASEEGTPFIAPGTTTRVTFTPRPAGFRWFHTHTMARNDLTRAQYGGQHGFLLVEPANDPAGDQTRYDQELFLALHDWRGHLLGSGDGAMNPTYDLSTINGKVLGFGDPLRVRQGQRILLHVLNSSPTEVHWVALAGHTLQVVALDGNAVPTSGRVPMLRLAPAERVCVVVEMNNPGVWVLGEVRKHIRAAGMGIVLEYAGHSGAPKWQQPPDLLWDYAAFAGPASAEATEVPVTNIPLVIESKFRGHGNMEGWTINGKSYPETVVDPFNQGARYRLQFINRSMDDHPLHLHRHLFELCTLGVPLKVGKESPTASPQRLHGIMKDTVLVPAQTGTTVEFTADHPGKTLLHCHQQNHMDLGFMMLLHYA